MKFGKMFAGLVVGASLFAVAPAGAETVQYNIVQEQSALSMGGFLSDSVAGPQTSGSLTTAYFGTINADRTGNTMQFLAGSVIDAVRQASKQQPDADGLPGSDFADYGRFSNDTVEAFRDVRMDLFSDPFTITAGSFPSNEFGIELTSCDEAYSFGTAFGTNDLSGKFSANGLTNPASTVLVSGGVETLTLKFNTGPIAYSTFFGAGSNTINFGGTIVATRTIVPEPGTLALLGLMAPMMLRRRGR